VSQRKNYDVGIVITSSREMVLHSRGKKLAKGESGATGVTSARDPRKVAPRNGRGSFIRRLRRRFLMEAWGSA